MPAVLFSAGVVMETTEFLRRVLSDTGRYCIFAVRGDDEPKRQRFFDTIEKAVNYGLVQDRDGFSVYFGLATYGEENTRVADNACEMRSLFLDLDCGSDKPFATKVEALEALQNFCTRLALPKPMVVDSGRGLHIYWPLAMPVPTATWLPVARRLKLLCAQHNFKVDAGVVADVARVLRLPGTHNRKDEPPTVVKVLHGASKGAHPIDWWSEQLGVPVGLEATLQVAPEYNATAELLMGNKQNSFRTILQRGEEGCAQLLYAATHQSEVDEPTWRAALSIAAFCSDADKAVHAISSQHPQYDPDETDTKANRIKGPYHCTRFDEYRPGVCPGCPHWGQLTSPITLGRELVAAETEDERTVVVETEGDAPDEVVVVPKPPAPYVRGIRGGVYRRTIDDDGNPEEVLIYHHDIYLTRRVWDVELGYVVVARLHLPRDGVREFIMSQQAVSSSDELRKALAMQGVTCKTKKQWDAMSMYITDYIEELQARSSADNSHRQFGWTEGFQSFVIGEREYFPDRVGYNPPTPATGFLYGAFEPRGTLDEWKELMRFYQGDGMELHQMVICAAFGSPLMAFSGVHALISHLDGPTGYGKTTTQLAMLGVYGKPMELLLDKKDTVNSKLNRFELMKNLPIAIDEITNHSAEEAGQLAYDATSGRQKNRMSSGSNIERHRGDPWALRVVSSANSSMISKISTVKANPEAERERIFEINISGYAHPHEKSRADEFQRAVKEHVYGVAAEPYLKWLVANVEIAQKFFKETQERLDTLSGLTSQNRIISAGYAADLTGGMIAKKLGLIDFDMKALFSFTVDMIKARAAALVDDTKTETDHLVEYLTEHYNDVLRINSTQRAGNGGVGDEFVVPDATPRGQYVARFEPDVKKLYLVPKPFRKWCIGQQLNPDAMLRGLREEYPVTRARIRLGRGTKMALPPTDTYVIEFPLEEHVDGGTAAA